MVLIVGNFLLNLLCSVVTCEPNFGVPQISQKPTYFRESRHLSPEPIVFTKSGAVEGYSMKIINGRTIYAFEGIFYGESPTGELRFQNPVPKMPWDGIRQAKKPSSICLQFHLIKVARITGSEDCLSLNIYTPTLPTTTNYSPKLPVFIWIHGGGGWYGAGSEVGPSYLLQEDVIMVSINYRLGILGFLSTGDQEATGNYGLKDQALAIQWVADNIEAFSGDPKKLILIGVSSGATFAHLHMMSPLTKHLISGAISLSGSAMNNWAVSSEEKVQRLKNRLAKNLKCPSDSGSKLLMECIRAVDPRTLIRAERRLFDFFIFPVIIYHAVVEPPGPGAFLTDYPMNLYARDEVAHIPWISSQTTDEAESVIAIYRNSGTYTYLQKRWGRIAADVLDYRYVTTNVSETTKAINQFYLNSPDARPTAAEATDIVSDRLFRVGIHRSLQYHSQIAPTYAMRFGFKSEVGFATIWGLDPLEHGVGHGTDSGFYFNSSAYFRPLKVGTTSYDVSRMMINQFANFAYSGEPYLRYKNGHSARMWQPVTNPLKIKYLLIDNQNAVNIPEPRAEAITFWENLGLQDTSPNPFKAWVSNYKIPSFQHYDEFEQENII